MFSSYGISEFHVNAPDDPVHPIFFAWPVRERVFMLEFREDLQVLHQFSVYAQQECQESFLARGRIRKCGWLTNEVIVRSFARCLYIPTVVDVTDLLRRLVPVKIEKARAVILVQLKAQAS